MTRFAFGAVVMLAACAWPARADDEELKKTVKKLAEKMQAATLKGDAAALIDLTHPKVVEEAGGKEKAVALTRDILKMMSDKGFAVKSVKTGDPTAPVRVGKDIYVLVPTQLEMTTPKGKVTGSSYILGHSTDGGKTWGFVDGAPGPTEIRKMFPDLPKTFDLPKPEWKVVKD